MKAHYRTRNGRMTFEVESESQKGIFRGIAELQAVFEADWKCGCHRKGNTLFAKRKDDQGNLLPAGGWAVYQGKHGGTQQSEDRPALVSSPRRMA